MIAEDNLLTTILLYYLVIDLNNILYLNDILRCYNFLIIKLIGFE